MTWNDLIYQLKEWEKVDPGILDKTAYFWDTAGMEQIELNNVDQRGEEELIHPPRPNY